MANELRTRDGLPFNFVDGLRIKGVDVTNWDKVFIDQGASYVGFTPVGNLGATNVQGALAELDVEKVDNSALAATAGSSLVGHDGSTVQAVLDTVKPIANYTALRAYTGSATQVRVTTTGIAGFFYRDDADTTSGDNGGTVIVANNGKRWKRLFDGAVNVKWFGPTGIGSSDDTDSIKSAAVVAAGKKLFFPRGTYLCDGVLGSMPSMEGEGFSSTTIIYTGTSANFIVFGSRSYKGITVKSTNPTYAVDFTRTGTAFQSFTDFRWIGVFPALAGSCLLDMNGAISVSFDEACSFEGMDIQIRGQKSDGTGFCNGISIKNTMFNVYGSCAIKNPGQGWSLDQVVFEPSADAGLTPKSVLAIDCDPAIRALGIDISGSWFGDNGGSSAVSYIKFIGDGLSISGSYINGTGFNNCHVVETIGASSGISVEGNYISNFASVVKTNDIATDVSVGANKLRFVTGKILGTFTNTPLVTGISFPAIGVASSNPNTLDDYEEGVFAPVIIGTTVAGSASYTDQIGRYTKIGNRVFFTIRINWSGHTGTGGIRVNGLPFASNSDPNTTACTVHSRLLTFAGQIVGLITNSSTTITPSVMQSGAEPADLAIAASGGLRISGHYDV